MKNILKQYLKLGSYLKYIIVLGFSKYNGLYLLILSTLFSIIVEFLAIYIASSPIESNIITDKSWIPIIFIVLLLIRFLTLFITESFFVYYAKELQVYFSSSALRKVLNSNLKKIEKKEIGHYTSFAGDEASNASQVIISFFNLINNAVLIIAYMILMILYSSELVYFTVFSFFILIICFKYIYQYTFRLSNLQAELRRETNSVFIDSFNGLRMIKAFGIESFMADEYKNLSDKYFTVNSKLVILSYLGKYIPLVLILFFYSIVYVLFYFDGSTSGIGAVIASLFILLRLLHSVGGFASIIGKIIGELKGTINIIDFLREETLHSKEEVLEKKIESIIFKDVSFSYNSSIIFHNLNISFNRGKTYAIVGKTGSGKSTLLDLLMDFITPTNGNILINDILTNNINEKSLTNKILYVGQESIIFNTTIKKNLEIDKNYSDCEIEKAVQIASLNDMLQSLDNGLEYLLQYRGTNISGGQKQRLNISRAVLRNPDVLILDESVNALDEKTRHKIVKNILNEYRDKIVIFVTHDMDILSFVDEVIDLDKIKEQNI